MNKKTMWAVVILVVLAASLGGFYFYKVWWPTKQLKIQAGLSSDKFPWRDYTQDELNRLYPQIKYADVPTHVTPEQTYANFREALRTNNLEMALEQLGRENEERYKEHKIILEQAYKEKMFIVLFDAYPDKIEKQSMYETLAAYSYVEKKDGRNLQQTIEFSKDANGDWKMDSL